MLTPTLITALPLVALAVTAHLAPVPADADNGGAIAMPRAQAAKPPAVPIPLMYGYNPPAIPIPITRGLLLSSASYRVDNANGPFLRTSWMSVATSTGGTYYLRCHEARAGYLRNGAYLRPITVTTIYGRSRVRRGVNECHAGSTPSPAGMKTAYEVVFRNARGTVTRHAKVILDTSRRYVQV